MAPEDNIGEPKEPLDVSDPNLEVEEEGTNNDPLTGDPDTVTGLENEDDTALEEYYRARRAREALDEATEEERINALVEARLRQQKGKERDDTERDELNRVYRETVGNIITGIRGRKFYNEEGDEVVMDDNDIQRLVINHVNTMNSRQREVVTNALADRLAEEASNRLPADVRDKFVTEVEGKEIGEWLVAFAEMMAPKTKFASRVEADKEVAVKAALARGRAQGQKLPVGSPPDGTEQTREPKAPNQYDFSKSYDRARALVNQDISESEFRELTRKANSGQL